MIQILNWKTGEIIFEGNYPSIKEAIEAAVKEGVSLAFAHLAGADLTDINLTGVNLTGVNLTGVNFAWANLTGANFRDANLTGAMFYMAILTGANFRGATITGANFCNAILVWADFTRANLSDTNFAGADLAWTNLTGAIFRDSTLAGVNLYMAILTDTDLTDANLKEVKFERVILTDTRPEKKTIKYRTVKVVDCDDWDNLVQNTYGKPYNLKQQNGCMERGRLQISVPSKWTGDFKNTTIDDSRYDMGVSFKAWLEKEPEGTDDFQKETFWERKFYPSLEMVANDLYEKGLLEEGTYEIDIDW